MSRLGYAVIVCALLVAFDVHAQPSEGDQAEAKALLVAGSNLFKREQYAEALDNLERSYEKVPSPNSALMIARCLVRLDRPVEAYGRFQEAERGAAERMATQPRYKRTHDSAHNEGEALRATLGAVRVRVPRAPEGTAVELQGQRQNLDDEREAVLLGRPGSAEVIAHLPDGATVKKEVTIDAGSEARATIELPRAAPDPAPKPPPPSGVPWQVPAAIVAGGVSVVSFGLFIGFGVHNMNIYDRLEESCAPACGPEHADEIEEGETAGIVANVMLAVGIVAAAASATFVILYATDDRTTEVALSAGGFHVKGTF